MKVIVIGAGIAGLGAATFFSRKGHEVSVIEASDYVGGRAITYRRSRSNDRVDAGSQYYHSNYSRALGLIRDVGLEKSLSKVRGYTRIYSDDHSAGSFLLNHRTPWYTATGVVGNLQLGHYILTGLIKYPMNPFNDKKQSVADQLNGLLQSNNPLIRESIVRPLSLTGALCEPEQMEISFLHVLRLIRIILLTDYLSLDNGTASLHEKLAQRLTVRMEAAATSLIEENGKVIGVEIAGRSEVLKADHIVVATTPLAAARIIPTSWQDERAYLESVVQPSFSLPTFFLDRPMQKKVWSYMLTQQVDRKIGFITDAAQKNPNMMPSGKAAIQPWICYPASKELVGLSDNEIISLCEKELEELFPGFASWVEEVHIAHHACAVPFTPVGHQARSLAFMHQARNRGVSFCGDYLSGGYMESALWSAEAAAASYFADR